MLTEKTLVIIKPDANSEQIKEIKRRFEDAGFRTLETKVLLASKEEMKEHYSEHKGKDFFKELVQFMISSPCEFMILEREQAIYKGREVLKEIRQEMRDHSRPLRENLCHASDCESSAKREIELWFGKEK
jgi:nucleoside-diphosphate kinase